MTEVAELGLARHPRRRGFTVVELLVVIAVIGILMSLITVAAYSALWTARQTRIKVEIDNLSMALKAFKEKYGSYPPINFYDPKTNSDLKSFVARAFPRYKQGPNAQNLEADLVALGVDITKKNGDPAAALVFWLSGFRPDVTSPFCDPQNRANDGGPREKLFDFEATRVVNVQTGQVVNMTDTRPVNYRPGQWVYMQPVQNVPYVYYDSRNYLRRDPPVSNPPPNAFTYNAKGFVSPYWHDKNNNGAIDQGESFVNPDSFQLIAAGQDGQFGSDATGADTFVHMYPTGVNLDSASKKYPYFPEEKDNVTNFCEKNNLEDSKP